MKNVHGKQWDFEKSVTIDGEKFICGEKVKIKYNPSKCNGVILSGEIKDIKCSNGKHCFIVLDVSTAQPFMAELYDIESIEKIDVEVECLHIEKDELELIYSKINTLKNTISEMRTELAKLK